MWSALKRAFGKPSRSNAPASRIDRLTYAIGDVHGRNDLLKRLLDIIKEDAEREDEKPRIVMLGDYVDRGDDSAGVLDTILELEGSSWCDTQVLLGNHEEMLKRFLLDSDYGSDWVTFGGDATLASYGVTPPSPRSETELWVEARKQLSHAMPSAHLSLLRRAALHYTAGDYLFVHGGVKPGVPLDQQGAETFLWIRDEFLKSPKACEKVVVHGHSARQQVSNQNWRIGVDTGAYATGILTAVKLKEATRTFVKSTRE
ncbi:metallophosphoesterase family protein [Asticcacaulis sp.]|uniref:metallophosphoesterase family protein n=1 Tax=Asticcacaulis sp. TaxID=1872648 RepID=UPI0039190067